MFRHDDATALCERTLEPGYVRPAYGGHSFANVAPTVGERLGVSVSGEPLAVSAFESDSKTVVLVVIDGFGFEQFDRHHDAHPFFSSLATQTTVWPLTSVFPSETAAAMGTLTTGVPPVQHGRIGWNVPIEGTIVEPLPFRCKDGTAVSERFDVDRRAFISGASVAGQLAEGGVPTTQVVPEGHVTVDPDHSLIEQRRYDSLDAFASELQSAVRRTDGGFVYAYLPHVDGAGHQHGTHAPAYTETVASVGSALNEALIGLPSAVSARTQLFVTADHGQVDTDPSTNVDLLEIPSLSLYIDRDQQGTPRIGGGGRNVHFYPEAEEIPALKSALETTFGDSALVYSREEALEAGLFGLGNPSETFERLSGELLLIPRKKTVWHGETPELSFIGFHGGLHPDEQLVPFAAIELEALS